MSSRITNARGSSIRARGLIALVALTCSLACAGAPPRPVPPTEATADSEVCSTPEGEVLIISLREIELVAGESTELTVYSSSHPGAFERLPDGCTVRWAAEGAAIDPAGRVSVAPDATTGSTFEVHATLADGRVVSSTGRVVQRGSGSVVGTFREVGRVSCEGTTAVAPEHPIRELVFRGDGTFTVTWMPFESRYDYWGTYTYDEARGTLGLAIEAHNYLPEDLHPEGTVTFDGDAGIHLHGLWLGSSPEGQEARRCEQIFERAH